MGRRKKETGTEPELKPQPDRQPQAPAPTVGPAGPLREYVAEMTPMRVGRFDLLSAEFTGLAETELTRFHEALSIHTRGWMILRRLFGISLVIPKRGTPEDDLRTWTRDELMAGLGITSAQLREELDRLRGVWEGVNKKQQATEERLGNERQGDAKQELWFASDATVKANGMDGLLLRDEIPWMAGRLEACEAVLHHPQVGEMMRMALLAELDLRRLMTKMARTSKEILETKVEERQKTLEREYDWAFKKRTELTKAYQDQVEKIDAIFPVMKQAAGQLSWRQVVSDFIVCHTEWQKNPANAPADGVFCPGEIEVLMRMSMQAPEPQYRADLVVYLNQARAFLWDPKWDGKFAPGTMKKLRAGFTSAAVETSKADGETLVDLMSDDPTRGEYAAVRA